MSLTLVSRFKPFLGILEFVRIFLPANKNSIKTFEIEFAKVMKQKYAIAFPYGRTGLIFLLKVLGLKDKEIICPAYTCVVVPHAIVFSGNIPVFVDSQLNDFNMDLKLVEKAISSKTGAIIATSIFGNPINLEQLEKIRQKYPNIHIIQDCAHSFGAEWNGVKVNTAGIAAIYGFNISKTITSVFGGMVTTDSKDLYENLRNLREEQLKAVGIIKSFKRRVYLLAVYIAFNSFIYKIVNFLERHKFLNKFVKYFDETKINMPIDYLDKLSTFEAQIGLIQTRKYNEILARRKMVGFEYDKFFGIRENPGRTFSHYPILVKDREEVLSHARKQGVQLGTVIDYTCNSMQVYNDCKFVTKHHNVEHIKDHIVNIPVTSMINKQKNKLLEILLLRKI